MITFPIIRLMLMKFIRTALLAGFGLVVLAACEGEPLPSADPATQLLTNVILIDGTGAPQRKDSVRIQGGKIIDVGELKERPNDIVIDGGGQVLAPGFIDTHSHADTELFDQPSAPAAVSQGITTVVIGQDGGSPLPLFDFRLKLLDQPVAINVASYSGHNTLRRHVLGENYQREATEPEIAVMSQFLREDMQAGALGLATGLEYDPGIYSSTEEVIALARVAAGYGGRYISHVRSEGSLEDLRPRGAGTFPRVLGRYVREMGLLGLEQAVHKMTGLSAKHMGFVDRGVIRPGAAADLVLFDPDSVIDNATPQNPGALSGGISKTWVNGQIVFEDGRASGLVPGRFIARANTLAE